MADDYSLPAEQRLLNLINQDNGGAGITLEQVIFGTPEVTTEFGRNTKIQVTGVPGSGLTGTRTFWYNRLNLDTLFAAVTEDDFVIRVDNPTNTWDLLDTILSTWDVNVSQDDVMQASFSGTTATLTAKATSLAWIGSTSVTVYPLISPLNTLITPPTLTGFNYQGQGPGYANEDAFISSEAQLLALINNNFSLSLTLSDVSFGAPTSITPDVDGRNTSVLVSALSDTNYSGTVTVTYKRVNLATAYPDGFDMLGSVIGLGSTSAVLERLQTQIGLAIEVGELVDEPLDEFPFESTLLLNATSYVYTPGSTVHVTHSEAFEYELDDDGSIALADGGGAALLD